MIEDDVKTKRAGPGRPPKHPKRGTADARVQIRVPKVYREMWDRLGSPEWFMGKLDELAQQQGAAEPK